MKQRITLLVTMLLIGISTSIRANDATWLNVHYVSGQVKSSSLQSVRSLYFPMGDSERLLGIRLHGTEEEFSSFAEVEGLTFGEKKATVGVENADVNGCQVFVAGKHMLVARSNVSILSLQVINLSGQVVCSERFAEGLTQVTMYAPWAPSMYIVLAETANGPSTHKVLIR